MATVQEFQASLTDLKRQVGTQTLILNTNTSSKQLAEAELSKIKGQIAEFQRLNPNSANLSNPTYRDLVFASSKANTRVLELEESIQRTVDLILKLNTEITEIQNSVISETAQAPQEAETFPVSQSQIVPVDISGVDSTVLDQTQNEQALNEAVIAQAEPYNRAFGTTEDVEAALNQDVIDQYEPAVYDEVVLDARERHSTSSQAISQDWRFRIHLAPNADYLYNARGDTVLAPLRKTDGVLFPYVPSISYSYTAQYSEDELTHTNFKFQNYRSSSISAINVTGTFTAQDENEASYVFAMLHFFKSATKMFYGSNEKSGMPPPILYLTGFGTYMFDSHPVVLSSFSHTPETNADWIRVNTSMESITAQTVNPAKVLSVSSERLRAAGLGSSPPAFNRKRSESFAYIPASLTVTLTFQPVQSRADIANTFDFDKFASGQLIRKNSKNNRSTW